MAQAAAGPSTGTHRVVLSPSVLQSLEHDEAQDKDNGVVAFKYKFKPSSITHTSDGVLHPPGGASSDGVLAMQHANGEEQSAFRVREERAKKLDCVLIWDEEAEVFTLHPLSTTMSLTLDRNLVAPQITKRKRREEIVDEYEDMEPVTEPNQEEEVDDDELSRQLQEQLQEESEAPPEVIIVDAESPIDTLPSAQSPSPTRRKSRTPSPSPSLVPPPVPAPARATRSTASPTRPVSPVASLTASTNLSKRPTTPEVSVFQPRKKKRPSAAPAVQPPNGGKQTSAREMAAKAWGKSATQILHEDVAPEPEADAGADAEGDEDDLDDFAAMMEQSLAQPTPVKPATRGKGSRGGRGSRGRGGKTRGAAAAAAAPAVAADDEFVEVIPEPPQPASAKSLTAMMGLPDDDDDDDSSDESSDDD